MPRKPDRPIVSKTGRRKISSESQNAIVATATLKAGSRAVAVIAAVLGIAGQSGLGDEVTLFAMGGVCFILALTLGLTAFIMSRTATRSHVGEALTSDREQKTPLDQPRAARWSRSESPRPENRQDTK